MSTKRLWGLTIVRLGLLAAFLLCNLHNTTLPVVFKNDAFPVAFMVVLSVTNGFCGTVGPSRAQSASHSLRHALLTSQVNPGSLYRCGKRT